MRTGGCSEWRRAAMVRVRISLRSARIFSPWARFEIRRFYVGVFQQLILNKTVYSSRALLPLEARIGVAACCVRFANCTAYYSILLMLVYFVQKRGDLPFDWIFLMFGTFIVACGTTHLMEIWRQWHPTYWLSRFIKVITAFASVSTAVLLVPLIPKD